MTLLLSGPSLICHTNSNQDTHHRYKYQEIASQKQQRDLPRQQPHQVAEPRYHHYPEKSEHGAVHWLVHVTDHNQAKDDAQDHSQIQNPALMPNISARDGEQGFEWMPVQSQNLKNAIENPPHSDEDEDRKRYLQCGLEGALCIRESKFQPTPDAQVAAK